MGKAGYRLGVLLALSGLLLAAAPTGRPSTLARAEGAAPLSCSGQGTSTPMQGHYTGTWHSDGDYHFAVYNTDLELKIIIDGRLDVNVDATGQVSGTATGSVDAPVYDYGRKDVSSGTGTISGKISGSLDGGAPSLLLSHPVIDMHWGTFAPDNYTVERFITMPDYLFPAGGSGCVSAQGSISEQNFPQQIIVADGTDQSPVQAVGVGSAGGTWQVSSDGASTYDELSRQVDTFISQANAALAGSPTALSLPAFQQKIVGPLRTLEDSINSHPDVARCLLERLAAWETSAVPPLFNQARSLSTTAGLVSLRQAGDLIRAARLLERDCVIPDNGAAGSVLSADRNQLDLALEGRDWSAAALWMREIVLLQGDSIRQPLQLQINLDLHTSLGRSSGSAQTLDIGRVAYALGDDQDAAAAAARLTAHRLSFINRAQAHQKKKPRKRKPAAPKPKPTPTATPRPATLEQVMAAGAARIDGQAHGAPPSFTWKGVPGATRYIVTVSPAQGPAPLWAWSGGSTSVAYGDTALEGAPNTAADGWPLDIQPKTPYTWSVLALDSHGRIVGVMLRTRL